VFPPHPVLKLSSDLNNTHSISLMRQGRLSRTVWILHFFVCKKNHFQVCFGSVYPRSMKETRTFR
jgi:hypothetical protein